MLSLTIQSDLLNCNIMITDITSTIIRTCTRVNVNAARYTKVSQRYDTFSLHLTSRTSVLPRQNLCTINLNLKQ